MVQIWRSRWDWFHRPIHVVAHLLHPLYKDVGKWSDHVLAEGWAKYTQRVYDATIQNKLEDDVLDFKYSRGFFARPIAQMRDNHLAPISWWEKFGNMNEELQHLALRVLSQDCTTGAAERVWSICGDIHTKKRNR